MRAAEDKKILMEMNTEDFNTMRSMLSEIEIKIMQLDPIKQRNFYKPLQHLISEAWQDTCNNDDAFLYASQDK